MIENILNRALKLKMIKRGEGNKMVQSEDIHGKQRVEFLRDLLQSYIDSYFVVLESLNLLLDHGNNIEQKYLTNCLHEVIQKMYYRGLLRFISSCLKETLENAFGRFSELGVCISQVF